MTTSARLLALLGLLQSRPSWTGPELAARLEVTERTIRNDIERLRALDYPVHADLGRAGGYRLGDSGRLPPLLLSDSEAVAVAVGLTAAGASEALAEPTQTAIAKLERVLPARLRTRAQSLRESTDVGPANTGTNVADPAVDPELLAELALAVRRREGLRFWYRDDERGGGRSVPAGQLAAAVVPGRSTPTGRRPGRRSGWTGCGSGCRERVASPRIPLPGGDYASFVLRDVASTGWAVHARILVDAPAAEVLATDQRHRRGGGDRRRRSLRAGHRGRQPGDRGRLDRHARPDVPRRPAAGAGRPRPAAGGALPRCAASCRA